MSASVKFEVVSTPLFKETPFSGNFINSEKESGGEGKAEECAALLLLFKRFLVILFLIPSLQARTRGRELLEQVLDRAII